MDNELSTPFDLSQMVVGLCRNGNAQVVPQAQGPPARIEGLTVGAPVMDGPAPHAGEMHPDGDELLFVVSGRLSVYLEDQGGERELRLAAGEAVVVPRGVWHRVVPLETSQLVHITPGPGGQHRPLRRRETSC
jgi:mannose-6-phosphate isomerase-like protein (cupin superfamily)